jgi:hypothetical protein
VVVKAGKEAEVSREVNKVVAAAKAGKAAARVGKAAEVRADKGAEVSRGAAVVVRSKPRGGQGRPPFPFHSDAMNLRSRDFNLLIRDQRAS